MSKGVQTRGGCPPGVSKASAAVSVLGCQHERFARTQRPIYHDPLLACGAAASSAKPPLSPYRHRLWGQRASVVCAGPCCCRQSRAAAMPAAAAAAAAAQAEPSIAVWATGLALHTAGPPQGWTSSGAKAGPTGSQTMRSSRRSHTLWVAAVRSGATRSDTAWPAGYLLKPGQRDKTARWSCWTNVVSLVPIAERPALAVLRELRVTRSPWGLPVRRGECRTALTVVPERRVRPGCTVLVQFSPKKSSVG